MSITEVWRPTPAHVRAVVGGLVGAAGAVLLRRPDLLVLAAPLACAAVWGALRRPVSSPQVTETVGQTTLREGQVTRRVVRVEDATGRVEDVAAVFDPAPWIEQAEHGRLVTGLADDAGDALHVTVRPTRWGRHRLSPALIVGSSAWNAYRFVWRNSRQLGDILTLPEPALFDAVAPAVHAPGLIGVNRSPQHGSGAEFATIRPFQLGDRLRRVHWPATLRADRLHVATTFADQDRHVALLVDAFDDVGMSGGVFGTASSLDIELRATAAIAEHYIHSGDRVSMVTMGSLPFRRIPPGVGPRHLRRLLELLARTEPSRVLDDEGRVPRGLGRGALAILVSPLLSTGALQRLVAIADRGFDVIAIDCLPADIREQSVDEHVRLTWRMAVLERERRLDQVRATGIPIVRWRGPGSLDQVLRALYRRANLRAGGR